MRLPEAGWSKRHPHPLPPARSGDSLRARIERGAANAVEKYRQEDRRHESLGTRDDRHRRAKELHELADALERVKD